jgi:hypothetical protein
MILVELKKFFNLDTDDSDEIDDFVDSELFAMRNYFNSKVPVQKIFHPKIEKIIKLDDLYLLQNPLPEKELQFLLKPFDSDNLEEVYNAYNQQLNVLKQNLFNSNRPKNIAFVAGLMVKIELQYAEKWFLTNSWDEETKISQIPNPMEILHAIAEASKKGIISFEDLKNNQNKTPQILLNEMKRLSLLFEKYK